MKYIVIPNIKINNGNAQPTWWLVSAPALTAYAGFAHNLTLKLNALRHHGVAIIHHDLQLLGENIKTSFSFHPHKFSSSGLIDNLDHIGKGKTYNRPSDQPNIRCHLNISLVIALEDSVRISPVEIDSFLRGGRIAGGTIMQHGKVNYETSTDDDAIEVIRKISKKNNFSIIERQDLMIKQEGDRDMLDVLLRNTTTIFPKKTDKKSTKKTRLWIMPTCLGYAGISPWAQRDYARDGLNHLYVEPLVGLIEYKNVKDAGLHFWQYTHPKSDVFLLKTNQRRL